MGGDLLAANSRKTRDALAAHGTRESLENLKAWRGEILSPCSRCTCLVVAWDEISQESSVN